MKNGVNDLVPVDELHWDPKTGMYNILSHGQTEEIIEACLRIGMKSHSEILKVVKEYETVMSGVMLFNQFLSGRVGIYEFASDGSPIFEKVHDDEFKEIQFWSFESKEDAAEQGDFKECSGRFVVCDCEAEWDILDLYRAVLNFCQRWGIDIISGESPDDSPHAVDDSEFLVALRRRSWSVVEVEQGDGFVKIKATLFGRWLRTRH